MRIITVSGAHSGVGKTLIVTKLLKGLKNWSVLKVTVSRNGSCQKGRNCGVCDNLTESFSVITDDKIISQKGKDTARFRGAGAKEVIWLQARPRGLKRGLERAISKFKKTEGLIIEGTSVLRHIRPSLAIFVAGRDKRLRPVAALAYKKADVVLEINAGMSLRRGRRTTKPRSL
jgi:molybdopterin-guanine dinucleotide biosynthesis protein